MNPVCIIQARTGSSRLPGKVLAKLANHTVLHYVIRRCQQTRNLSSILVATTKHAADDPVASLAESLGASVYRGSENDVLKRYAEAAIREKADPIIRITADCPLIDPAVIDEMIDLYIKYPYDYVFIEGYPRGSDGAEVLSFSSLQRTLKETSPDDTYYREHVMTYIVDHPEKFRLKIEKAPEPLRRPDLRLCVDEQADLDVVRYICGHFAPREDFTLSEIIAFLDQHPKIAALNRHVKQKNCQA